MLIRLLAVLGLTWSGAAWADGPAIPGQDAPEFLEARAAWLDGDDLPALKSLKTLAEGGNTAAQILFARIAEEPHMHRHVTNRLTRKDRNGFLRQPGGISGVSWLEAAKGESELAAAILLSKLAFSIEQRDDGSRYSPDAENAVAALLKHGETDMATEVAFKLYDGNFMRSTLDLMTRFESDLDQVIAPTKLALELLVAVFFEDSEPRSEAAEISQVYDDLHQIYDARMSEIPPEIILGASRLDILKLMHDEQKQSDLKMYAERVRAWQPLVTLCESSCPTTYSDCLLAGAISIGPTSRFPFSSPAQSFISNDAYWSSARIRSDAARRLAEVDQYFEVGARFDQCFADTVMGLAE